MTEHVSGRLRRQERQGRVIHLKVRFSDFRTITRSKTLTQPTDVTQDIWQVAAELLDQLMSTCRQGVRLIGVGVGGLAGDRPVQQRLFDDEGREKQRQLDTVADAVRTKFGSSALSRGSGLLHDARHRPNPQTGEPE